MGVKGKRTLRTALIVLLAVIFCLCLFVMIRLLGGYKAGGDIYEKARLEFTSARPKETPPHPHLPIPRRPPLP